MMHQRWQVLGKRTPDADWAFVGEVHAPDAELALLLARDAFFRHREGVDVAVVRGEERLELGDPDRLAFHTDKSYKEQRGYPLGPKRRRAQQRVRAAGARIDRPRPGRREPEPDQPASDSVTADHPQTRIAGTVGPP